MQSAQQAFWFLVALGPLIIFHELGHYLVARLFNVKVAGFSIGFGNVLWSRKVGPDQTLWAIRMLPLGGFVRWFDSIEASGQAVTDEDRKREYTHQSVWRRMAIAVAGPVANFLLAIIVIAGLYMVGVAEPDTHLGPVKEGSSAAQAGLRKGDKILVANEAPVLAWTELRAQAINAAMDKSPLRLDGLHADGARFSTAIDTRSLAGLDLDTDPMGKLGLDYAPPKAIFDIISPGGAAEKAGLHVGDKVIEIDGQAVEDAVDLVRIVGAAGGKSLDMTIARDTGQVHVKVTPQVGEPGKPARIGVGLRPPDMVNVARGPLASIAKASNATWAMSVMSVKMIGKIITGQASIKNITGVLTMADYAEKTARAGAIDFLQFIAFVSISLGVMNLLPIPVLDGGLLLYYSLEVLTGRPLSQRAGLIAQQFGFALLVALMALALYNDVLRRMGS